MATIKLYKKAKNQPCYRLSYRDPLTRRWRQRLLPCNRDEAEETRKKVAAEFAWYETNPHLRKGVSTIGLGEAIKQFLKTKEHTVSASTAVRYRFGLHHVEETLGSDLPLTDINSISGDKVISYCLDEGDLATSTVNTVLTHFTILLNWAYDRELIDRIPSIKKLKMQKKPIRWLSKDKVKKILENCSDIFGDLIKLYILTGARRNELLYCEWKQIDLKSNRILLPRVKSKQKEYLYLNKQAKSIILKYRDSKPRPFQWTKDQVRHEYARTCEKAGIKSTIHDLRRTCGARLVEKGIDIFRVSKFLRHSSVKVTQDHYVDLLPSDYPLVAENIEI
jgi:integrase